MKRAKVTPGTVFRCVGFDARLFLLALTVMPGIASCGIFKPKTVVEYRDSIRVEYRDRVVHDTATFEIVREVEKVVTKDTASRLENSYAVSDALVSDGLLYHSLETKPQTIIKPVEVHVTDTLIVEKESQVIHDTVEVEKKLSAWQSFRIGAFWWLVLAVILFAFPWILKLIKKYV